MLLLRHLVWRKAKRPCVHRLPFGWTLDLTGYFTMWKTYDCNLHNKCIWRLLQHDGIWHQSNTAVVVMIHTDNHHFNILNCPRPKRYFVYYHAKLRQTANIHISGAGHFCFENYLKTIIQLSKRSFYRSTRLITSVTWPFKCSHYVPPFVDTRVDWRRVVKPDRGPSIGRLGCYGCESPVQASIKAF